MSATKVNGRMAGGQGGKRKQFHRDDEITIDGIDGWKLVEVTEWRREGWINLKLYRLGKARKRVYYLGVSIKEKRLARNKDKVILLERFPEIENWVINSTINYSVDK